MATNHTENLGLNQWEAEDAVLRSDFNEDNRKIDAALSKLGNVFAIGEIPDHDFTTALTIELGRKPAMVIVFSKCGFKNATSAYSPGHLVATRYSPGYRDEYNSSPSYAPLTITNSGFSLAKNALSTQWGPFYYLALFDPAE